LKEGIVLFAHGSRDPAWAAPFRAIQAKTARARPDLEVELAFLELMQPTLEDAVDALCARGHEDVIIAPLFMAQGAHLKRDLAQIVAALRARHPNVALDVLPAAGEIDAVLDAIGAWLAKAV
jgi:sirohydrochlorin cobaltochelatase